MSRYRKECLALAHELGADYPGTWNALAFVYKRRPVVEAKIDLLEGDDGQRKTAA
jgi:hypothetical protein